ncbi:MAG TPA: hypothetical protein DDW37_11475 [Verrucomicrobiales bacterium]|nr:hypothetical protein [Verrucomicrobiales bacterium]
MTFKAFIIGLLATFGIPWLLLVVVPYSTMRSLEPVKYEKNSELSGAFVPKRDGRIREGSKIFGQEGCALCHTQVIRPTYAGNDVHRGEWAGLRKSSSVDEDTRRETIAQDFQQEQVAHVGQTRVGPDLSNFGRRLEHYLKLNKSNRTPEQWSLMHLYNPKGVPRYEVPETGAQIITSWKSTCPPKGGFFKKVQVNGAGHGNLPIEIEEGIGIKPTDRARALASYLVSLKKDTLGNPLPEALNFNPKAPKSEE